MVGMLLSNRSKLTVESLPPLKANTISSVLHKIVKAKKQNFFQPLPLQSPIPALLSPWESNTIFSVLNKIVKAQKHHFLSVITLAEP
jgi:hypothetical protein